MTADSQEVSYWLPVLCLALVGCDTLQPLSTSHQRLSSEPSSDSQLPWWVDHLSATDAPTPSMKPELVLSLSYKTLPHLSGHKEDEDPKQAFGRHQILTLLYDANRACHGCAVASRFCNRNSTPPAYHLSRPHACKESCIFKDGLRQRGRESASGRSFESFDLFIQKLGEHILRCNALASRVLYSATALKL